MDRGGPFVAIGELNTASRAGDRSESIVGACRHHTCPCGSQAGGSLDGWAANGSGNRSRGGENTGMHRIRAIRKRGLAKRKNGELGA
jgi:hypothetical protein